MSTISRAGRLPLREQIGRGDQDAGRAEPALQRVMLVERLLQRAPRQALDRAQLAAVDLDGEHQARAHRDAVELDRAGAADPVLAADVRARQAELVAQEVAQKQARLDLGARGRLPFTRSADHAAACPNAWVSARSTTDPGQRAQVRGRHVLVPERVDERARPRTRLARRLGASPGAPTRSRSSSVGRSTTAPTPTRACVIVPSCSPSEHAHAASAKSPWRSANSAKPTAPPCGHVVSEQQLVGLEQRS